MKSFYSKFILAPVALAAVALGAGSAMAAETTVHVPFNFTAGGQACPAGYYTVQHDDTASFVSLTSKDSLRTFTWVVGPGAPNPTDRKIALKFDQVNGTRVLQSVQFGRLVTSRLDRKALQQMERESQLTGGR